MTRPGRPPIGAGLPSSRARRSLCLIGEAAAPPAPERLCLRSIVAGDESACARTGRPAEPNAGSRVTALRVGRVGRSALASSVPRPEHEHPHWRGGAPRRDQRPKPGHAARGRWSGNLWPPEPASCACGYTAGRPPAPAAAERGSGERGAAPRVRAAHDVLDRVPLCPQCIRHGGRGTETSLTVKRMDNVGIVVEDLDAAIEFFTELGLTLEGRMPIEGEWAGRVTGVRDQRVEIAMMRT